MKRIIALLLSCILLFSTASASSLFPTPEPTPASASEKAPSYGAWAGVQPVRAGEVSNNNYTKFKFTGTEFEYNTVSFENYYTYIAHLVEQGYSLTALWTYTVKAGYAHGMQISNGKLSYYIIYIPDINTLVDSYPSGIKYESSDSQKTYTDSKENAAPIIAPTPTPPTACPHCYGGWVDCSTCNTFGMCSYCDGFGYRSYYTSKGYEYVDCGVCNGTGACSRCGYEGFLICTYCGGTGVQ